MLVLQEIMGQFVDVVDALDAGVHVAGVALVVETFVRPVLRR